MDKSTIIYIIAIGIFILTKVLGKKKQQEAPKAGGGSFLDALFGEDAATTPKQSADPFEEIFESFGKKQPVTEPAPEPKPTSFRYSTVEAESKEDVILQSRDEELDSADNGIFQPLDVLPDENDFFANQEVFSHIGAFETDAQDEATINANNEIGKETHSMIDSNNLRAFHQDFSLRKAVLYSEVMKPKFQEF